MVVILGLEFPRICIYDEVNLYSHALDQILAPREEDEDLELGNGFPELGVTGHRSTHAIAGHHTTKSEKKPLANHCSNRRPSLDGKFERFAKVAILFAIFSSGVFGGEKENLEV
ncbi:hypothetical protein TIFTF001_032870 [Ficus carica]|uniref:Uncharacterized protein n=1 Tax=Ficus carica TaxID=3494 RepID=A0AA88J2Y2_FICCA|nr:hypothetical protein TIFTF001_032870 [Ficus carica]